MLASYLRAVVIFLCSAIFVSNSTSITGLPVLTSASQWWRKTALFSPLAFHIRKCIIIWVEFALCISLPFCEPFNITGFSVTAVSSLLLLIWILSVHVINMFGQLTRITDGTPSSNFLISIFLECRPRESFLLSLLATLPFPGCFDLAILRPIFLYLPFDCFPWLRPAVRSVPAGPSAQKRGSDPWVGTGRRRRTATLEKFPPSVPLVLESWWCWCCPTSRTFSRSLLKFAFLVPLLHGRDPPWWFAPSTLGFGPSQWPTDPPSSLEISFGGLSTLTPTMALLDGSVEVRLRWALLAPCWCSTFLPGVNPLWDGSGEVEGWASLNREKMLNLSEKRLSRSFDETVVAISATPEQWLWCISRTKEDNGKIYFSLLAEVSIFPFCVGPLSVDDLEESSHWRFGKTKWLMLEHGIEEEASWLLVPLKALWEFNVWTVGALWGACDGEKGRVVNALGFPPFALFLGLPHDTFNIYVLFVGLGPWGTVGKGVNGGFFPPANHFGPWRCGLV